MYTIIHTMLPFPLFLPSLSLLFASWILILILVVSHWPVLLVELHPHLVLLLKLSTILHLLHLLIIVSYAIISNSVMQCYY